ncbi:MAG TPA: DUF1592 domain-containing protein [Polyangia bacterium]
MPSARAHFTLAASTLTLLLAGCVGSSAGDNSGRGTGSGGSNKGSGGTSSSGSGSSGGPSASGSGGGAGPSGSGGSSGQGSGGSNGSGGDAGQVAACPTTVITPTPLRRLTKAEYANAVRDLLKVDAAPAADLPADEETNGFDNNAGVLTVSPLHAEKYVLVSETLAKAAVQKLSNLTTCDTAAKGEEACALEFARSFGRRAFRRPTTSDDEKLLMAAYGAGKDGGSYAEGLEVMIRAALQSTDFLYRLEVTPPSNASATLVPLSPYELATRLSFMLWGSGPDDSLLDAAARGDLSSKDAVATKARAMLKDDRARAAVDHFYAQWMSTSRLDVITKDHNLFPKYSADVQVAMAAEGPAFINDLLWNGDRSLKSLLTSQSAFVNAALAPIYGVSAPSGTGTDLKMVSLPANQGRAGILTQAGFLAVQAHPDQTSPVLRGKFVRTRLLCNDVPPPPDNVNISVPDVSSAGTARERFSAHLTAASSCAQCHQLMDPIGLTFEHFDAVGSYRDKENGRDIDASGMIAGAQEAALQGGFDGVRALADKLAASRQVSDCVSTQWFRYAAGRTEETPDGCSLTTLHDAFAASKGDLVEMMVATTQTDAFWYRAPITP